MSNHGNNKFGYLRFEVPARTVTAALLRLFVSGNSPNAFHVLPRADTGWDETSLTYDTAPDLYSLVPLATIEGRPDGWHEVDVTEYVRRHMAAKRGANLCFGLRAVANDARVIQVDTREGNNPPRLVIQCDDSSG